MSEVSKERNKDYRNEGLRYIRKWGQKGRRQEMDQRKNDRGKPITEQDEGFIVLTLNRVRQHMAWSSICNFSHQRPCAWVPPRLKSLQLHINGSQLSTLQFLDIPVTANSKSTLTK